MTVTFPTPKELTVDMVLDTGAPLSALSQATLDRLLEAGLAVDDPNRRFRVQHVLIENRPVGPLSFRVSPRVTEVGANGLLGLDFLMRYREVRFDTSRLELTLVP